MRIFKLGVILVMVLLQGLALAQVVPANPVDTQQITMPVFTLNPAPAMGASVGVVGTSGIQTIYYWVVVNYLVGSSSVSGPYITTSAPNTLSGSNYVTIIPMIQVGALSYDLLKTSTNRQPNGVCNCAVVTGVPLNGVTADQSNSTGAYTVTPININALGLTLQNEVISAGVSHLILRQNGLFVSDLSASGGGVTFPLTVPSSTCVSPQIFSADDSTIGFALNGSSGIHLCGSDVYIDNGGIVALSFALTNGNALLTASGSMDVTGLNLITSGSCIQNGSSANPSIVACGSASGGIFTCNSAASGGTCEVHTEFVRDRAVILVQEVSYSSPNFPSTCNTTPTAVPAIKVASVTNGGSGSGKFVVNMPTFSVNPMCYSFLIVGQ